MDIEGNRYEPGSNPNDLKESIEHGERFFKFLKGHDGPLEEPMSLSAVDHRLSTTLMK